MSAELIEGGGVSQFRHVVRQLGYNKDVDIEFGTVTAPLPDIRVQVNGMKFELEADDLVVCEHLRAHSRQATIGGSNVEIAYKDALEVGDRVALAMFNKGQAYIVLDRI